MHRRVAFALTVAVVATTRAFAVSLSHFPDAMFHDGMEGPFTDADAARFLAQATA